MTWDIFLGIVAIVGFICTIGKVIANNTKVMTEVKCSIDDLKEAFNQQKNDYSKLEDKVTNHEIRITKLEN